MKAPLPPDETERLQALRRYAILDTVSEREFDDITLLASHICSTPIALITLLDEHRQWFKSKVGIRASETSRDISFCAHTILQTDVFVVEDAQQDQRFANNPLVTGDPKIRFYAGSPLITSEGHALGTLCVIDQVPRGLSAEQKTALQALGRQVIAQLELRRSLTELRQSEERFVGAFEHAPIGVALVLPDGRWLKVNRALCGLVGYSEAELLACTFQTITHPDDLEVDLENVRRMLAGEISSYSMEKRYVHKRGHFITALLHVSLVRDAQRRPLYFISQIQDITERAGAKSELLESKRFLQSTLDALSSHIAILDERGTIIEVNAAWNRFAIHNHFMGGKSGVGDNYLQLCDSAAGKFSEEAPAVAGGIRAIIAGQQDEFHLEYPCHSPQEPRWFVVRVTRFSGDGPVRVVVAHENITERKQAEAAVMEASALLETLLENTTDGIYFKDRQSRFVHFSQRMLDIFHLARTDELKGKTDFDFFAEEHARPAFVAEQEIIRTGKPIINLEEKDIHLDGRVSWVSTSKMAWRDPAGNIIGTMGTSRDITERKLNEVALQQQQAELRVLFDFVPAMIWFKNTENRILRVNQRAADAVGRTVAEIEGKPSAEIYPADAAKFYADDLEVIRSGRPKLGIVETIRDQEGKELWLQTDKIPVFDKAREIIGIIVMAQDITERKQLEAHLFQSQKLETVGKLAGGIAHEFNNIMTAIIGQSELLLLDLPPGSPLCESAIEIRKSADRAAGLTRQLLAYGRKQILRPELLDLNTLLAGMETMLRHMVGRSVDVRIIPHLKLPVIRADAGQIEQVIINMVINAAEAMPNGGKLTLETTHATLDADYVSPFPELKADEYVVLAITDTGAGMSQEVKARIFEPFFTTKGVGKGPGLGLATCHGIIKQSGGHISVDSEPGRGATFKIYLPQVLQPDKVPAQILNTPNLPSGSETILLVEDDSALRQMAAKLLRQLGYKVLTAANGIEALNLTDQPNREHIDVLFTDVVMPHMSGKELAERIRALLPETKILFTSVFTENAIIHQGVLTEGVTLLQKPFTPVALALKVREILDKKPNS